MARHRSLSEQSDSQLGRSLSERNPVWEGALTRWLGVGLASLIAIMTIWLAIAGKLTLYIAPEAVWYAVPAAVALLIAAIAAMALPLGREDHTHHDVPVPENTVVVGDSPSSGAREHGHSHSPAGRWSAITVGVAAVVASVFVVLAFVLPPKSLSVELAMSRNPANTVLFEGADDRVLGAAADTSTFGIGEWSSVFRTTTQPENYDGKPVQLTGFLTPGASDKQAALTRMVVTHCVIDAQPVSLPMEAPAWESTYGVGQWVQIDGVIRATDEGKLEIVPDTVTAIEEPEAPYEF